MVWILQIVISDIKGMEGLGELFEIILMALIVTFFFNFGFELIHRYKGKGVLGIEKKMATGFSLFFTTLGAGYLTYVIDRIWRYYFGEDSRIFAVADFSSVSRDYILITFIGILIAFTAFSFVIERYILNRKVILAWICLSGAIYAIILRPAEFFLLPISPTATMLLGAPLYIIAMVMLVMLLLLHLAIVRKSPRSTSLWKRSIILATGLLVMVPQFLFINNLISKNAGVFSFIAPVISLVSIFAVYYGASKMHAAMIDYYMNEHICIVHRGKITGKLVTCENCGIFYCSGCRDAIVAIDNRCWNCNAPLELREENRNADGDPGIVENRMQYKPAGIKNTNEMKDHQPNE